MMNMMSIEGKYIAIILLAGLFFGSTSCQRERSSATGWEYNNPKNGGFYKAPFLEQETGIVRKASISHLAPRPANVW